MEKRTVRILDQNVVLDTDALYFSENTLSEYLEKEGGWIDYFGAKLADAERQLAECELRVEQEENEYDRKYSLIFTDLKAAEGGSDKFTEGKAKIDPTVIESQNKIITYKRDLVAAKHAVRMVQQHLKAWQLNHENAQNRGNTLRREMDRRDTIYEKDIEKIVKEVNFNG